MLASVFVIIQSLAISEKITWKVEMVRLPCNNVVLVLRLSWHTDLYKNYQSPYKSLRIAWESNNSLVAKFVPFQMPPLELPMSIRYVPMTRHYAKLALRSGIFLSIKIQRFLGCLIFFQGHECTWVLYIQRKNPNAKPYSEKRILTVLVPTTWKRKTAACWKKGSSVLKFLQVHFLAKLL